jgi:hypothetical protein
MISASVRSLERLIKPSVTRSSRRTRTGTSTGYWAHLASGGTTQTPSILSLKTKAFVSAINGGILPDVSEPHLLPKKGEIIHFEVAANLMEEEAVKEYRGGYSGFSFPIGKTGVRYRVGGTRGRLVQVGTQMNVVDSGLLAITNKRAVYMGSRKTIDMPLSKLINLNVFDDGVQFQMSNRVNPPLFQTEHSDIVAALVNAAAQRLE